MNIILFGGGFDPIHLGHLNMAKQASKIIDGDVYFLPSRLSVWKEKSAPVEDKIKMIELAIKDEERFHIDLFEVNSGKEHNYSIDTVRYFAKKFPNDKIYYLIGTDQVNEFHRWKDAEELSTIAQIIYFSRPQMKVKKENVDKYHIQKLDCDDLVDVSSSEIRELKSLKLTDEVLDYIAKHNLYYMERLHAYLKDKRLSHCVSVAALAYKVAKAHNLENPDRAYIAGLLHDIGKETESREIMEKEFPEFLDIGPFSYHQFIGSLIARRDFHIEDKEIIEAIEFHATGNANMSDLGKIIYASDKIEPTRSFDSSDLIKALMEKPLDEAFKIVLSANRDFLISQKKSYDNRLTSNCFKFYLD